MKIRLQLAPYQSGGTIQLDRKIWRFCWRKRNPVTSKISQENITLKTTDKNLALKIQKKLLAKYDFE